MGMFDTVICLYPLPGLDFPLDSFQTKSLYCGLENYVIDHDGFLYKMDRRDNRLLAVSYDGDMVFYTGVEISGTRYWIQYKAEFIQGKMVDVQPDPVGIGNLESYFKREE